MVHIFQEVVCEEAGRETQGDQHCQIVMAMFVLECTVREEFGYEIICRNLDLTDTCWIN